MRQHRAHQRGDERQGGAYQGNDDEAARASKQACQRSTDEADAEKEPDVWPWPAIRRHRASTEVKWSWSFTILMPPSGVGTRRSVVRRPPVSLREGAPDMLSQSRRERHDIPGGATRFVISYG